MLYKNTNVINTVYKQLHKLYMNDIKKECGARTADPQVGVVGMDQVRTKHAVPPRRGPVTTTRHEARQTYATRGRRFSGTAVLPGPTRILPCNTHRGAA